MQTAMIDAFWVIGLKAGLLVLLAELAIRLLAARRPGLELTIWRAVLVAIACLAPLQAILPYWRLNVLDQVSSVTLAPLVNSDVVGVAMPTAWAQGAWLVELGLLVYVVGALIALTRLLLSLYRLWRWTARATPVRETDTCKMISRLAGRMQITGRVRVRRSGQIGGPLSWGLWPPTILLPSGHNVDAKIALEHAVAHELAHLKRGDWAWHLLACAVNALCWWNPLVTLAMRCHSEWTEQACDRLAVGHCDSVQAYARSLLAAAGRPGEALAMSMAERSGLGRRIESLINLDTRRQEMKPIHTQFCNLAVLVLALPLAACSLTQAAELNPLAPTAEADAIVATPMAAPNTASLPVPMVVAASAPLSPLSPQMLAAPRAAVAIVPDRSILAPPIAPTRVARAAQVARSEAVGARESAVQLGRESRVEANEAREQARNTHLVARNEAQRARSAARLIDSQRQVQRAQSAMHRAREQQREANGALEQALAHTQRQLESTQMELERVQEQLSQLRVERNMP